MEVQYKLYKQEYPPYTYTLICRVQYKNQVTLHTFIITEESLLYGSYDILSKVANDSLKACLMELGITLNSPEFEEAFEKATQALQSLDTNKYFSSGGSINTWPPIAPKQTASINDVEVSTIANMMPGVLQNVKYPCAHGYKSDSSLGVVIMHLNDNCGWSREQIADWLDKEHDAGNINIEFGSDPIEAKKKLSTKAYNIYELPLVPEDQVHPDWKTVGYTEDKLLGDN